TRIAHGLLTLAVASGLHFRLGLGEETLIALLGVNNLRFVSAVRVGDTLHCVVKVKEKKEVSKKDRGTVVFKDTVLNQKDEAVLEYERVLLFKRKRLRT
ncbi:MAG: acyl dehydratase, partial [Thaumarchaeota archaeon]|nr:acyl dehydratase [Nitrososphaerota archaeon]